MTRPFVQFHPRREAREQFSLDDELFQSNGDVVFTNLRAVHKLAEQLRATQPDIHASELNALGLLHEIEHALIDYYRKQTNPKIFEKLETFLSRKYGKKTFEHFLRSFCQHFPPLSVYRNELSAEAYLRGTTNGFPNRFLVLEELLTLWIDNLNPAFKPVKSLIDPSPLEKEIPFNKLKNDLKNFFRNEPPLPQTKHSLFEFLRQPAELYPHSVKAQLEYVKEQWQPFIGTLLTRLLQTLDFIKEEEKLRFDKAAFGPGPTVVPEFEPSAEPERFSEDTHWMPRLILIAKSTYVWLDQLSKKYARPIHRLDQIPDEELKNLAAFGITGLWLIGIWERSKASQKIKQLTGNPEALASAYSLYDYVVAEDLGGEPALQNLKERAMQYGIRMATDMVPNHTGIDSRWVIEHPDWFIQLPYSPFPQYSFNGPDLCEHPEVGVFIEDGYWNRSDAAVVFKRVHYPSGDTRYIYHGNDGTSMPWNDTAQLNYLNPEVREAVIQKIIEIARQFPIIRFDAAMTLTKKHFQRLWFPEPGQGGDIPSRAEFAMTKEEFDRLFPKEFWREVVDRIQAEVPDTLLLAEAFWLMESYFVRTLGMHRVYNSAFMNMLKNEENEKYRQLIKNVLAFNPQILKRYVNFMNNPDEETAAVQFGKGDKYFGVCTLMVTLPGLPMFGHGQLEGFTEKYGMEYRRAYWNEQEDRALVRQHYRLIAPLLHRRYLFADVENFLFYDVLDEDGRVQESVFAFSNRFEDQNALVVYNNSFSEAAGWIKESVPFNRNEEQVQLPLLAGLGLQGTAEHFVVFNDHVTGLEYIRRYSEMEEKGLFISLGAYKFNVFLDFHLVCSTPEAPYAELFTQLNGAGVPDLDRALRKIRFAPLHQIVASLLQDDFFAAHSQKRSSAEYSFDGLLQAFAQAAEEIALFEKKRPLGRSKIETLLKPLKHALNLLHSTLFEKNISGDTFSPVLLRLQQDFAPQFPELEIDLHVLRAWAVLRLLKAIYEPELPGSFDFFASRLFDEPFEAFLHALVEDSKNTTINLDLLKILAAFPQGIPFSSPSQVRLELEQLLSFAPTSAYLDIHSFENVYYFNKERFEELIFFLFFLNFLTTCSGTEQTCAKKLKDAQVVNSLFERAQKAGYKWYDFLESLSREV